MTQNDLAFEQNEYVAFWNEVLAPKFVRYRHVLVDGLTHHSERIMPRGFQGRTQ